jgi:hypothetical protein
MQNQQGIVRLHKGEWTIRPRALSAVNLPKLVQADPSSD